MTRIVLADDHPLVRRGLRQLLEKEPDFTVVAEAGDGAEAVKKAVLGDADLVILDVAMPRMTGLQAAEELSRYRPDARTLLLSMYDNDQYLFAAVRAGASGYILKSEADAEVVNACRALLAGEPFVYPADLPVSVREQIEQARAGRQSRDDVLTKRELEVLKLIAEGRSTQQIANALVISLRTVDRHRSNVMDKLGVRDRVQLARYAIRRGLIEP